MTINSAPAVTTSSLPAGEKGVNYTAPALTGSGGTPGYTWTASNLPAGLAINNGVISGKPTGALGTSNVTVTLTDTVGGTATAVLPLVIGVAPTANVTTVSPSSLGVGANQQERHHQRDQLPRRGHGELRRRRDGQQRHLGDRDPDRRERHRSGNRRYRACAPWR